MMYRILFFVFLILAGCNNSGNGKSEIDTAGGEMDTAGEDNHVMENNVIEQPGKKDNTMDDSSIDSAIAIPENTMVDTTSYSTSDSSMKY